jgi:tripartite-type tricarboxylate transporter receptor subunit TctC
MRALVRAAVRAAACLLCLAAALAQAQSAYPSKPIRFIAPFPPGGSSDVLCRILGQKLSELSAQPVVVENRAGASGNIGHEYAARQPADGYTLVLSNNAALAINPHLFKRLGFDPHGDFAPVAMVASAGQVLVVHPSVPAASVRELIALAKAKPGELHFGSGGKGIPSHVAGESFKVAAGIALVHVPYKGTGQAVADLVGGQVQLVFSDMVPAMPHIKAGKLRALAVTTDQRSAALPEIPTMDEAGLAGFRSAVWWAVLVPRGTPADIVARLNGDFARIVNMHEVKERYASLGVFTEHGTPQEVTEKIRSDTQEFARILKAAGVEAE